MAKLILASSSPYRRELLERFGLPFQAVAPKVDEEALAEGKNLDARSLALYLATEKAKSLTADFPDAIIIGSDQVAVAGANILRKPGSFERALEQLKVLRGQPHDLVTAMAVVQGNLIKNHVDVTTLHMRHLSDEALSRYLKEEKPYDCAGSYKIEKLGIALFERISGADPTAIQGLPLAALARRLSDFGIEVP